MKRKGIEKRGKILARFKFGDFVAIRQIAKFILYGTLGIDTSHNMAYMR